MKKEKDKGPEIKRNEDNSLDQDHATKVLTDLTGSLIHEKRAFEKDLSMRIAKENRRDIVVKVIIYQRNSIDGKIVMEDNSDPLFERLGEDFYRFKYFDHLDGEVLVREMPMSRANIGRWTMGCFKTVVNYLHRMNVMANI